MIVRIDNPDLSKNEKTWLTQRASDGTTTLTAESNEGFSADDYIIIGEVGEEEAEAVKVSSTSGDHTIVSDTAIKHDHPHGTPIYFTYWNQYSLEVKESGGSYAVISGMPLDIEWDSLYSEYYHSGATTDTYKVRFYNSQTGGYSSYSPEIAGTGHERDSVRYMIERVRKIARDPEGKVADNDEIRRWFNTCQDHVASLNDKWWFLLKEGTAISGEASGDQYALPSDYDRMDHLNLIFNDGTTNVQYRLKHVDLFEFEYETRDQDRDDDDDTEIFTLIPPDSTYAYGSFKVYPTPENAYHTFYPWYYKRMSDLADDNDQTDIPMPDILENFALAQIEKIRGNKTNATDYLQNVEIGINLLRRWQKPQTGQPKGFSFKGRTALKRYYRERRTYSDDEVINYW